MNSWTFDILYQAFLVNIGERVENANCFAQCLHWSLFICVFELVNSWEEDSSGNMHEEQIETWAVCACEVMIL